MQRLARTASNRSEAVVPDHRGYDRETLGWIRAGMRSMPPPARVEQLRTQHNHPSNFAGEYCFPLCRIDAQYVKSG